MKFRGKMTDPTSIRLFSQLIGTLYKFAKLMAEGLDLHLSAGIIGSQGQGLGFGGGAGAIAWCELPVQTYFSEFDMEGITPQDDEIYMQISAEVFASSLNTSKSSNNVTCLKMKLTKKIVACLTIEIESQTNNTPLTCTHDISVQIITRRNWPEYQCPEPLPFNISLNMPETKFLRLTIERMRNVAPKIVFKMSKAGKLVVSVSTYNVESNVTFNDLHVYNIDAEDEEQEPRRRSTNHLYSVEVEMRSILHLMPTDGAKPTSIICSMADSRLMHWLLHFGDIQVQYFVPGSAAV